MKGEILINGNKYPVKFTLGAIEDIFSSLEIDNFQELAEKMDTKKTAQAIRQVRTIALIGIQCGYDSLGEPCPVDENWMRNEVRKFSEIADVMPLFSGAINSFFTEGENTGEALAVGEENR